MNKKMGEWIYYNSIFVCFGSAVFVVLWHVYFLVARRPRPKGAILGSVVWFFLSIVFFVMMALVWMGGGWGSPSVSAHRLSIISSLVWASIIPVLLYKTGRELCPNAKYGPWNVKRKDLKRAWKKFREFLAREEEIY